MRPMKVDVTARATELSSVEGRKGSWRLMA
jgi:hypothetical protein